VSAPPGSPARSVVAQAVAAEAVAPVTDLHAYRDEVAGCTRCALAGGRTQVVFGSGESGARPMFGGQGPGLPPRADVYTATLLRSRPPESRDPLPEEIEACEAHLWRQIELIKPRVVATLGN